MKYKEIEVESFGQITKHIIIQRDDNSYVSFPASADNPTYIQFLKDLEAENGTLG